VAEHLQHAYVLTAHTIQGATVGWAGVVGRPEDFTRNWSYTALSRAREPTELFILDTPTERELDRNEIAPVQTRGLRDERTLIERLQTAMRCRDDEDLALDRLDTDRHRGPAHPEPAHAPMPAGAAGARPSVVQLQAELTQLRERIGQYPEHLADQLHAARSARAEAQRVADSARARIAELEQRARGVLRRRTGDCAERALQRQRLKLAEEEIAAAVERERHLASILPDRAQWDAERRVLRERAAELDAQLSSHRREHLRVVLERPAPYLSTALGALPDQPRARRTWQQAATRMRPTASTTLSPTPTTHWDHPQATSVSVRTGNAPTTTFSALSAISVSGSIAGTRTRSKQRFGSCRAAAWSRSAPGSHGHTSSSPCRTRPVQPRRSGAPDRNRGRSGSGARSPD
jgi:hypothetical protein